MANGNGIIGHQMEVGPLVGSGVIIQNIPCPSARVRLGGDAAPAALGSLSVYATKIHPHTEKLIQGFGWDERVWTTDATENHAMMLPANWDPSISGINNSYFQSGIGSNQDLKVEDLIHVPGAGLNQPGIRHVWAPEVRHGYYYDFAEGRYLFSDDSEIVYPTHAASLAGATGWPGDFSNVSLLSVPKASIPIRATQYSWNEADGRYNIALQVTKKIDFTGIKDSDNARVSTVNPIYGGPELSVVDQTQNEFIVTYSGIVAGSQSTPEVIFNNNYITEEGATISPPAGTEFVGTSDGKPNQLFHLKYSPVDGTQPAVIYSYLTVGGPLTTWTTIPFSSVVSVGVNEVRLDTDLGIIQFGDSGVGGTLIPAVGHTITANYWKTLKVEYEPESSANTTIATEASTNPIYRRSARGFVYLSTAVEDPASIILRADLPSIKTDLFGPLFIGSNFAPLTATVRDSRGQLLEDQVVTFQIESTPAVGSFSSLGLSTSSITGLRGAARAFYTPPRGIEEIGEIVTNDNFSVDASPVGHEPGVTNITVLNTKTLLIEGESQEQLDEIFLYKVLVDDPLLGALDTGVGAEDIEAQIESHYKAFWNEQKIYGPTGLTDAGGTTVSPGSINWEQHHRFIFSMQQPVIFQQGLNGGRKVLVARLNPDMLNPHDFTSGPTNTMGPVQPIRVDYVSEGNYNVIFDTSPPLPAIPAPTGNPYSYFIVTPTTVKIRASVFNERLNRIIQSNVIEIKLRIPDYLSGLWILDELEQVHIDEISQLLAVVVANGQKIPLGFRLRSSNVTLAAALDGVTFLDVNDLDLPILPPVIGQQLNVEIRAVFIGHQFTVI